MQKTNEAFTLYLANWQSRMVKDFLTSRKVSRIIVKPGVIQCPASYKIPANGISKRDWVLYLTDEQMVIIKEKFKLKTDVSGINITEELIKLKSVAFK